MWLHIFLLIAKLWLWLVFLHHIHTTVLSTEPESNVGQQQTWAHDVFRRTHPSAQLGKEDSDMDEDDKSLNKQQHP